MAEEKVRLQPLMQELANSAYHFLTYYEHLSRNFPNLYPETNTKDKWEELFKEFVETREIK